MSVRHGKNGVSNTANNLRQRMMARGLNGESLYLLNGNETVEQLRQTIIRLCQECAAGANHSHCPFRIMAGLSHGSIVNLVKNMPLASCQNLFELELNCRSQGEPL